MSYTSIPSNHIINTTKEALERNGLSVVVVENGEQAKQKALELIPQGSEVMTMTSVTLETIGLSTEINESKKYNSVRAKLNSLDRNTQKREMKILGGASEYAIGSVHAITQDGIVIIASNGGSQLGAYTYGSDHVIWIVGAQKITTNLDEAKKRLYDYVLPLESERAHKAYGVPGSNVSKLLIVNKETTPNRITIVLVKEILGF